MPRRRVSRYTTQEALGVELACSRCSTVLHAAVEPGDPMPQHRCAGSGRPEPFDLRIDLDTVPDPKRVDDQWFGEYMHTDF